MNWTIIEQLAITFMIQLLQIIIKNPTAKAELQGQLTSIANDIYAAYGTVPTIPAPEPTTPPPPTPAPTA